MDGRRENPITSRLTGTYRIGVSRAALAEAKRLFPRTGDYMAARAQALKLRFWPGGAGGQSVDINWDWIQACGNLGIGELRVEDTIGGHNNLRIIFFKPDTNKANLCEMPTIWVLRVMQKKRQSFTHNDVLIFKARRERIMNFFYKKS